MLLYGTAYMHQRADNGQVVGLHALSDEDLRPVGRDYPTWSWPVA